MKVTFSQKDRDQILSSIKEAMGDRKLAEMVDFSMEPGTLKVTISKMGTSTLNFVEKETDSGMEYALNEEKIAFAHRAFKDEVTDKIVKVVQKAGGSVSR